MSEIQFESVLACGRGEYIELGSRQPSIGRPRFERALPEPARSLSPNVCDTDYVLDSNGQAPLPMPSFGGGKQYQSEQTPMTPSLFSPNFFVANQPVQSTAVPTHPEGRKASVLPSFLDRASKEVEAKAQRSKRFARPLLSHRSTAPEGFTLLRSD